MTRGDTRGPAPAGARTSESDVEAGGAGPLATRRSVLRAGAGAAVAAVLGACAGGKGAGHTTTTLVATEPPPSTSPTTGPPPGPPVYPLTGLGPVDAAIASRPALSVKIDNAPRAMPQAGLDRADVVYEEVVEGGIVRFMAVFHSMDADLVGPIRSVRPVDAAILNTVKGYFAFSGGNLIFIDVVKRSPAVLLNAEELGDNNGKPFSRDRRRPQPYNLFSSTGALRAAANAAGQPPPPRLFTYRQAGTPLGGGATPARNLTVRMGERTEAAWSYADDSQSWVRKTNGGLQGLVGGGHLRTPNVVLQFVPYRDTQVHDASGAVSPEAIIEGEGEAWLLSGPAVVKGRWRRPGPSDVTQLVDASGAPMALEPGRTWVSLVPAGTVPAVS